MTGRTTRDQPSEYARPETIEETAERAGRPAAVGEPGATPAVAYGVTLLAIEATASGHHP